MFIKAKVSDTSTGRLNLTIVDCKFKADASANSAFDRLNLTIVDCKWLLGAVAVEEVHVLISP